MAGNMGVQPEPHPVLFQRSRHRRPNLQCPVGKCPAGRHSLHGTSRPRLGYGQQYRTLHADQPTALSWGVHRHRTVHKLGEVAQLAGPPFTVQQHGQTGRLRGGFAALPPGGVGVPKEQLALSLSNKHRPQIRGGNGDKSRIEESQLVHGV